MIYTLLPSLDMGDKRLTKRCNNLIKQFIIRPASSIPQACGSWKTTKAAYRFFDNDAISPAKILDAHRKQTERRLAKEQGIILVAQDTTDCDYTDHPKTKGLGYLQGEKLFGIKVHTALAMTETGIPLGILSQERWIRKKSEFGKWRLKGKRTIIQTENHRWISTYQEVVKRIPLRKHAVLIADRGAAIYDVFAQQRKNNVELLIRAKNRCVVSEQKMLYETMRARQTAGIIRLRLQKTPARKQRIATVRIRFAQVIILSLNKKQKMQLWCVTAEEQRPPTGEQRISWTLLTTVPVNSFEDAKKVILWYTRRWIIERFHYCLKSGCRIEELQLQEKKRLERALAIYCIVAWKLLYLTYYAREYPDHSCMELFSKDEYQALISMTRGKKKGFQKPPTIKEAVHLIASLGGFLGRKSDGDPGVKTLWIGLRRLSDIIATWRYLGGLKKDMGKG